MRQSPSERSPSAPTSLAAHAHNDYEHARPLLDALDAGFRSVEADVYYAGGKLAVSHDGNASDLRDQLTAGNAAPSVADRYDDEVNARDNYRTATWILGGAAIATATTGVLLYWFDRPAAEHLQLAPTSGGGAVTFSGRF